MPKYYELKVAGYYLYFTSFCIVECKHVHASDRKMTEVSSVSKHSSSTNEPYNPWLKALILQVVDNQLSANDPPITRREDYGRTES